MLTTWQFHHSAALSALGEDAEGLPQIIRHALEADHRFGPGIVQGYHGDSMLDQCGPNHPGLPQSFIARGVALSVIVSIDRVVLALSRGRIARDLHLTDAQMGLIFSAYASAYAICEVPSGYLGDRFGPRQVLLRIAVWWTAFMAATVPPRSALSRYVYDAAFVPGRGSRAAFRTSRACSRNR